MTKTAVQYGVGPIGGRIVREALDRGFTFVGAIDVDPEKTGRDLGDVVGTDELGVDVTDVSTDALAESPDVVFHSTVSSIERARPQIEEAMAAGADVVSTCEELSYPWVDNPTVAESLDAAGKEHGQTCLGTGINPGFAMDALPAMLSTACSRVHSVNVRRTQDAATRRKPLQAKVGAGMSVDRFESEIAEHAGHVGLRESVAMLSAALRLDLDEIRTSIDPVIADDRVESEHFTVEPGEVAGIDQSGRGIVDGESRITLELQMYLGATDPRDVVEFVGEPSLEVTVDGGFHGDVTTPAVVVNVVPSVEAADPGLATMIDVPMPSYRFR